MKLRTRMIHRNVLLLAAAVSEINRELLAVTDAEEATVLLDLLRDASSDVADT